MATNKEEGDFYPYRCLASEGFLPGYNFPALPVRAWIPREDGEYIPRPRFLALSEFGPNNIIYHEGAKWEVVSFQSPPGGLEERRIQKRLCSMCGSFSETALDCCPDCGTRFDPTNSELLTLLEQANARRRRSSSSQVIVQTFRKNQKDRPFPPLLRGMGEIGLGKPWQQVGSGRACRREQESPSSIRPKPAKISNTCATWRARRQ